MSFIGNLFKYILSRKLMNDPEMKRIAEKLDKVTESAMNTYQQKVNSGELRFTPELVKLCKSSFAYDLLPPPEEFVQKEIEGCKLEFTKKIWEWYNSYGYELNPPSEIKLQKSINNGNWDVYKSEVDWINKGWGYNLKEPK